MPVRSRSWSRQMAVFEERAKQFRLIHVALDQLDLLLTFTFIPTRDLPNKIQFDDPFCSIFMCVHLRNAIYNNCNVGPYRCPPQGVDYRHHFNNMWNKEPDLTHHSNVVQHHVPRCKRPVRLNCGQVRAPFVALVVPLVVASMVLLLWLQCPSYCGTNCPSYWSTTHCLCCGTTSCCSRCSSCFGT